jgi:hypothetical protein
MLFFKYQSFKGLACKDSIFTNKGSLLECNHYFWLLHKKKIEMKRITRARSKHNLILLGLNISYIFIIGLFTDSINTSFIYYTFISAIILVSILTISDESGRAFIVPILLVILTWVSEFLKMPLLSTITGWLSTLFFLVVIVMLVRRVANSKRVGGLEFVESINVYLLLGIAASILFAAVYSFDHGAYNPPGEIMNSQDDFIYYAFVTMTTLGYGDITPLDPAARSLSIFFSVAGQLYLTMIIALLVGKYASQKMEENADEKAG